MVREGYASGTLESQRSYSHKMSRALLVAFFGLVSRIFFRRIEVTGADEVPDGAVLFVGNHPNSLLDPVLVVTTAGRPVSFAAKDGLFKVPVLGWMIRSGGGVPIRRRMDHGGEAVDNSSAFAALLDVLREGGAMGIFPEGISHSGPELAPLKTGAARIALEAVEEGVPLHIVPVGLTYFARDRMRGRVLVHYGTPLRVQGMEGSGEDAERAAARALTEQIDEAMRDVTLNAPDFETQRALDVLRSLVSVDDQTDALAERAELNRLVADVWETRADEPEMQAVLRQAGAYAQVLDALEMRDEALRKGLDRSAWILRCMRHAVLLLVWLPLALPGVILHAPAIGAAVLLGRKLSPRDDVEATTKMMLVTMLVLLAYGVVTLILLLGLPIPTNMLAAGWGLVALMLSGWATIRVAERQATLRRALRVTLQLARWRRQIGFLRGERRALREQFFELVTDE